MGVSALHPIYYFLISFIFTYFKLTLQISSAGKCQIVASLVAPTELSLTKNLTDHNFHPRTQFEVLFTPLEILCRDLRSDPSSTSIQWLYFLSFSKATSESWVFFEPPRSFLPIEDLFVLQKHEHNLHLPCYIICTKSVLIGHISFSFTLILWSHKWWTDTCILCQIVVQYLQTTCSITWSIMTQGSPYFPRVYKTHSLVKFTS